MSLSKAEASHMTKNDELPRIFAETVDKPVNNNLDAAPPIVTGKLLFVCKSSI